MIKHCLKPIVLLCISLALSCIVSAQEERENKDQDFEKLMIEMGLVDISSYDASICVQLKYSTTDNFVKTDVYGKLSNAYLQPSVAKRLAAAQAHLRSLHAGYRLIVYDAARPHRIQAIMWKLIDCPESKKRLFLADPRKGSLHNYGCAVDLSIVDENGKELDMGTPFDFFGIKAYPIKEQMLLKNGTLSAKQVANRQLLRQCMRHAGFEGTTTEWWHFNACSRRTAQSKYKIIP